MELQVCFWEFLSDYDTRPRTREATLTLAELGAEVLSLPADGKTYCRIQNTAGHILQVQREDGRRLRFESLNPTGAPTQVADDDVDAHLARFAEDA